jgi:cytochrome P450
MAGAPACLIETAVLGPWPSRTTPAAATVIARARPVSYAGPAPSPKETLMTSSIDEQLVSHDLFTDAPRARALFAQLRREDPLHYTTAEGYPAFWAVTKHADVVEVERQHERFINAPLVFMRTTEYLRERERTGGNPLRVLINMDGADHRAHRALAQAWFMPQNLKNLEQMVAQRATEMVDRLLELGPECDFSRDIGQWYPLKVIMSLLGVPEQEHPLMLRLTQQLLAPGDPDLKRKEGDSDMAALKKVVGEFFAYFSQLVADRRANPRDDISTALANAQIDGQPIGQMELMSLLLNLSTAGHDTTASSLAGGLQALLEHPGEFEKLRAQPELLPSAIEEFFRWTTPIKHFCRTATEDYVLRGKQVRKGDILMLFYPSANFDEEVFPDGDQFRVDRTPNRHIAFGFGVHVCLGMHLSRMELKLFMAEFLRRVGRIELIGKPEQVRSNEVAGPKHLRVRYEAASA